MEEHIPQYNKIRKMLHYVILPHGLCYLHGGCIALREPQFHAPDVRYDSCEEYFQSSFVSYLHSLPEDAVRVLSLMADLEGFLWGEVRCYQGYYAPNNIQPGIESLVYPTVHFFLDNFFDRRYEKITDIEPCKSEQCVRYSIKCSFHHNCQDLIMMRDNVQSLQ